MWSIKLLQRSLRLTCRGNYGNQRKQQWIRTFSSSHVLQKRPSYYPTEKIKNMRDFEEFASAVEKKRLEILKAEFLSLCREGRLNMAEPTDDQWLLHMNLESFKARKRHFLRIQKNQHKKRKREEKKDEPKEEVVRTFEGDFFFRRLFKFTKNALIRSRVAQAMMLEDPILIDLGFADVLTYSEITLVVKQLYDLAGHINASALGPTPTLNVIFCNAKPSVQQNEFLRLLHARLKHEQGSEEGLDRFPVSLITEKSYLDLFPRDDLVYLTPDAHKYYHPAEDGIPIIGAIVDKTTEDKLTYTTAFEEEVKMRKLPIDLTVDKFYGSKRLPITHAVDYVSRLRFTGDPDQAKTTLAPRNFISPEEKARHVKKKKYTKCELKHLIDRDEN